MFQGSGLRVEVSEFRFSVQDSGFRVKGLEFSLRF